MQQNVAVAINFVAIGRNPCSEREYIEKTMFGRGVNLSYRQFGQMIYYVFESDDFPTIPFVQRLNVTNVINGHLVSH